MAEGSSGDGNCYNPSMEHFYAVVMAGGSGTRFWPLSRKNRPKQTLPILGDSTLVRRTVERIFPLFEPRQVFVITAREHADLVRGGWRMEFTSRKFRNCLDVWPTGKMTGTRCGT